MLGALERAGCRVIAHSEADRAPFRISFEAPNGEHLGILAYAFLAKRTPTHNRPADERTFQIKYGSKHTDPKRNLHRLWQDPFGLYTTLLLGIDPAEQFFVGADPEMHNPTRFFIRVEFKDQQAELIKKRGWYAWERQKRTLGLDDPVEVMVGGTADAFLQYIRFERAAVGLDQGNRQLLAERQQHLELELPKVASGDRLEGELADVHPLIRELDLTPTELLDVIAGAKRLRMAVRGWVAEEHLRTTIKELKGVTYCEATDGEGQPDLLVRYRGGRPITIECKNVLRRTAKGGYARVDFQRTRASKKDPCSRYYAPKDFDILAACLHAVTEKWEFRFVRPSRLEMHQKCTGKLSNNVTVTDAWMSDPRIIFDAINGAEV